MHIRYGGEAILKYLLCAPTMLGSCPYLIMNPHYKSAQCESSNSHFTDKETEAVTIQALVTANPFPFPPFKTSFCLWTVSFAQPTGHKEGTKHIAGGQPSVTLFRSNWCSPYTLTDTPQPPVTSFPGYPHSHWKGSWELRTSPTFEYHGNSLGTTGQLKKGWSYCAVDGCD